MLVNMIHAVRIVHRMIYSIVHTTNFPWDLTEYLTESTDSHTAARPWTPPLYYTPPPNSASFGTDRNLTSLPLVPITRRPLYRVGISASSPHSLVSVSSALRFLLSFLFCSSLLDVSSRWFWFSDSWMVHIFAR